MLTTYPLFSLLCHLYFVHVCLVDCFLFEVKGYFPLLIFTPMCIFTIFFFFFIKYYTFNSGYLKKNFNRLTYIVILKILFLWVTKSFVQHNCVYDSLYGCLDCIGFILYLLILWYFSWCWSQFCLIFGYIFTEYSKNWECSTFLVTVQMHFFSILFYSLLMTLFLFTVYTPTIWLEQTL